MKQSKFKKYAAVGILVLPVVGFIEDLHTPVGVDDWLWYFVALLLTIFVGGRILPFVLAAVFTFLTLVGFELSPPGIENSLALTNCFMGIGVLWVTAVLVFLQKKRESALRKSEERYRSLFESMHEGFAHCRMLYEGDKPEDFIYLEVNRSFEMITGLKNVVGRRVTEVIPGIREAHPELFEIYGRVASTGQPEKFEFHLETSRVWLNISVFSTAKGFFVAALENITERKCADEQVRKLSQAVEQSPASIVITDTDGIIEYVNPKFSEVTGRSAEEVIGKNPRILKSGEMPSEGYKRLWETIKSGKEWRGEFQNRKKNGELFWESAAISPIFDTAGRITHFLAIKEDITQRKQSEDELVWKTAFLEAQVDSTIDGMLVVDSRGRRILQNKRLIELMKAPAHIAQDDDDEKLFQWVTSRVKNPAQFVERVAHLNSHPDETGREEIELVDGTVLDRYSAPVLSRTGKYFGRIWTFREITEHKRAEEKIREQAALLDEASDAIWVLDANECISYWNKGAERLYGWNATEAIGKNPLELLYKGIMTPALESCIKSTNERGEWAGQLDEFTKEGKPVTIQGRGNAIYDGNGARKGILIISTDITEKKKLEAQFLRAQRMESIGTLAGGIAHDLNNVLAPLLMSVEFLRDSIGNAEGRQVLDDLETNIQRGTNLVKQVLTFGRGLKGERVLFQPARVIREVGQIIRESFPKSVVFESGVPTELWSINGDSTQLHQVLLNLCVNARDAMPDGGKLSIHAENAMLDEVHSAMIPESKPGPHVVISVTDTGTGMPQEIQEHIFEPFFTTKNPGKGTGLGLSTTLGIVKSHGGFINCYSRLGKGTTFKVYLPANPMPAAETVATGQSNLLRGGSELVLVVDDEEPIRYAARRMLEHFGYRVLLASDGAEAVSLYASRQDEIAVIVTDMDMPVMDGSTAIIALKSINPKVKIIGSSGLVSNHSAAGASNATADHFISKPYSTAVLLQVLHNLLNGAVEDAVPAVAVGDART